MIRLNFEKFQNFHFEDLTVIFEGKHINDNQVNFWILRTQSIYYFQFFNENSHNRNGQFKKIAEIIYRVNS